MGDLPSERCKLVILADDLTGACDAAAAACVTWGTVAVATSPTGFTSGDVLPSCVAINMDSRGMNAVAAASLTKQVVDLVRRDAEHFIIKVDSTFEGVPGAVIAAALESLPARLAVVCPANPRQGRLVRGGMLVRRDSSELRNLAAMLERDASLPVRQVASWREVTPSRCLPGERERASSELFVCDAEDASDLVALVVESGALTPPPLFAGSAALVGTVAASLAFSNASRSTAPCPTLTAPFVGIIGSSNPVTEVQVARLAATHPCHFHDVNSSASLEDWNGVGPLLIRIRYGPDMAQRLVPLLLSLERSSPGTLLVSGGETAKAVCDAARSSRLTVFREAFSGVAQCQFDDGSLMAWRLLTKPGGFGDDDLLVRLFEGLVH
ncbi:MAG TPA: four-carbon acid sugar kinase family protein [Lacipirellulaceae bacterium]|nr:four-carbon acid sugar kinase family protein [Lacipirellulaceae bacterium]HMP06624.1 four-carbon acid sugar kinase family protein [Lacipirellulaceae bacterium]